MQRNNFKEMSCINSTNNRIGQLGSFIQDIENQLWDGHPHIYPNLRIFLEEWCDLIIDVGIGLKIHKVKNGKNCKEICKYYDELIKQNNLEESLCGKEMYVDESAWSFSLKIYTVECVFSEKGIDPKRWGLSIFQSRKPNENNLKDKLNSRSHKFTPISENIEEAFAQFEARFGILQILHDGVYKDFLENVLNIKVDPYLMPNKMDIIGMVSRYYGVFNIEN